MNLDFETFLKIQNKSYDDIRKSQKDVLKEGIEPDPALIKRQGGFFVVLVHPRVIAEKAMRLSRDIAKRTPAIVYGSIHIHTTIGRCSSGFGPHFYFDDHNDRQGVDLLRKLTDVVSNTVEDIPRGALEIVYEECLLTRYAVIVAGTPNEWFVKIVNVIINEGKRIGIEVNPPWGGHITLSRFTEPHKMSPTLHSMVSKTKPLGRSVPIGIAVGYTSRKPSEKNCGDLRDTPGHFTPYRVFLFGK